MMWKLFLSISLPVFLSCSLLRGYKKREFVYGNDDKTLALLIPSGYSKEETRTDSLGNKERVYHYRNGASLYFARTMVVKDMQPIDKQNNIPLAHPYGGLMYKGLDERGLYWREMQRNGFRFGYKNVPSNWEIKFDSSVNYAGYQRVRR